MRLGDIGPNTNVIWQYRSEIGTAWVKSQRDLIGVLERWKEIAPDALETARRWNEHQMEEFIRVRDLTFRWHQELPSSMTGKYGAVLLPSVLLYLYFRSKQDAITQYEALGVGIRNGDIQRRFGALWLEVRLRSMVERGDRFILP